jgi:hypothetical protein
MLEFKLGPYPQQGMQRNVDGVPLDQMFQPFEFIVRKTLPDPRIHAEYSDPYPLPRNGVLRILMEAIWQAAEENQGQQSFQQITFVNCLDNLLSAVSYLLYDQGRREPLPASIQILLSMLLEATASLEDKPAIIKAVSLLSKYSQANPDHSRGVQEAETSLMRLLEKLPPGDAREGKEPQVPSNNGPSGPDDSSASVHQYSLASSQLQATSQIHKVQDPRLFDFHTDWFDTYIFPVVNSSADIIRYIPPPPL